MSAYPGFTDGDLERHATYEKAGIRFQRAMGREGGKEHTAHTDELDRIEAEQKRRSR